MDVNTCETSMTRVIFWGAQRVLSLPPALAKEAMLSVPSILRGAPLQWYNSMLCTNDMHLCTTDIMSHHLDGAQCDVGLAHVSV